MFANSLALVNPRIKVVFVFEISNLSVCFLNLLYLCNCSLYDVIASSQSSSCTSLVLLQHIVAVIGE